MKKSNLCNWRSSFIGSNLVDELVNRGHYVTIVDNFVTGNKRNISHHKKSDVKLLKVDLSKHNNLNKIVKGNDFVFHLAGLADIVPSIEKPKEYFKTNVEGTFKLLNACKDLKIRKFIYAASASCYGIPKKYPTDEKSKIDTKYPYALTKFLGEELVMHFAKIYKMPNLFQIF